MGAYQSFVIARRRADQLARAAMIARQFALNVTARGAAPAQAVATRLTTAAVRQAASAAAAKAAYDKAKGRIQVTGWVLTVLNVVLVVAFAVTAIRWLPEWLFVIEGGLCLAVLASLGLAINGRVLGAAIDARNRVSLSKLQMYIWLGLTLAALIAVAVYWMHDPTAPSPLAPGDKAWAAAKAAAAAAKQAAPTKQPDLVPGELLFALGLSATSFVATPMLLSLKSNEQPTQDSVDKVADARGVTPQNQGKVDAREDPAEASFADIFHGDELGTSLSIDVSKVQQIAIGLLVVGLYAGAIFTALKSTGGQVLGLPAMNPDFVKLLAISHASYLGYKAAPKSSSPTAS
jgi:hypothetical protein